VSAPDPIYLVVLLMWYFALSHRIFEVVAKLDCFALSCLCCVGSGSDENSYPVGSNYAASAACTLFKPLKAFSCASSVCSASLACLQLRLLLNPRIYDLTTQLSREVMQRWQRNYAFGGRSKK
jgi:hypothetical protein